MIGVVAGVSGGAPATCCAGTEIGAKSKTCCMMHVVQGCTQVAVIVPDDLAVARALADSADTDLTLLQTNIQPPLFATFRTTDPVVVEPTYALGHPFLATLWQI